jgi:hypothetical protein
MEEITGKKVIIRGSGFSFCVEGEAELRYQHYGPANLPAIPWELFKARRDSVTGVIPWQDANIPVLWRPYHEMNGA